MSDIREELYSPPPIYISSQITVRALAVDTRLKRVSLALLDMQPNTSMNFYLDLVEQTYKEGPFAQPDDDPEAHAYLLPDGTNQSNLGLVELLADVGDWKHALMKIRNEGPVNMEEELGGPVMPRYTILLGRNDDVYDIVSKYDHLGEIGGVQMVVEIKWHKVAPLPRNAPANARRHYVLPT